MSDDPARAAQLAERHRALQIREATGRCRHFTGASNGACAAGVNYREVTGGPDFGWALRLPCGLKLPAPSDQIPATCAQYDGITVEEATAAVDAQNRRSAAGLEALVAVETDAARRGLGKGRPGTGEIPCPVCGGRLRYRVQPGRGHIWGACETKGCVRWMT